MSTETGKLADLLRFHPTCAPVSHNLRDLASASAYGAYEASFDAAWAPAREAATGGLSALTCAPVSPEPEAMSHDPGAVIPPTPSTPEAETLLRVSQTLQHASTRVQAIADEATKLQDECTRLRGVLRQLAVNADSSPFGRACSAIIDAALNGTLPAPASAGEVQASTEQPNPHMRAAASHEPNPRTEG